MKPRGLGVPTSFHKFAHKFRTKVQRWASESPALEATAITVGNGLFHLYRPRTGGGLLAARLAHAYAVHHEAYDVHCILLQLRGSPFRS